MILFFACFLLCIPFVGWSVVKEYKSNHEKELHDEIEDLRDENENFEMAWKNLFKENEELKIQLEEKKTLCEELKAERDSYWRQLSGFLQRHPEEVETIDEDEINNPDDYKYVAR